MITATFIGIQKGFGGQAWDLYNLNAPGSRHHGTTFMVDHGTPPAKVQAVAAAKAAS